MCDDVERVARALILWDSGGDLAMWHKATEDEREYYREGARAAIEAMPSSSALRDAALEEAAKVAELHMTNGRRFYGRGAADQIVAAIRTLKSERGDHLEQSQ